MAARIRWKGAQASAASGRRASLPLRVKRAQALLRRRKLCSKLSNFCRVVSPLKPALERRLKRLGFVDPRVKGPSVRILTPREFRRVAVSKDGTDRLATRRPRWIMTKRLAPFAECAFLAAGCRRLELGCGTARGGHGYVERRDRACRNIGWLERVVRCFNCRRRRHCGRVDGTRRRLRG